MQGDTARIAHNKINRDNNVEAYGMMELSVLPAGSDTGRKAVSPQTPVPYGISDRTFGRH